MNVFDSSLTKSLEDFMENYKMIDVEQIYSNGTEFVPIFRVKQWLEYNNINNLQSKIDKISEYIDKIYDVMDYKDYPPYLDEIYYTLHPELKEDK